MTDIEESEARANALLAERAITGAQQRAACVTLAGLALIAARGDEQAAKGMLREALEAIGAVPYQRTPAPYFYGQAPS
jgi:hypothetical protein